MDCMAFSFTGEEVAAVSLACLKVLGMYRSWRECAAKQMTVAADQTVMGARMGSVLDEQKCTVVGVHSSALFVHSSFSLKKRFQKKKLGGRRT